MEDMDREKSVILEEIRMTQDNPEDLVHELFTQISAPRAGETDSRDAGDGFVAYARTPRDWFNAGTRPTTW